jgi:NAD(P)-dependent dehydrogenase (short-subunit alcohol dehydrogenase family)
MSFENLSVVVFGATGGIGSALARQLARRGCRLTLAARDQSRLVILAGELQADICPIEATVSDAVERCLVAASEKYGRLDGVVNCVGSLFLKPAHATRDADWADVLSTKLTTSFYILRSAARLMMRSGGGSIVLLASAVAQRGMINPK